jgi:predicted PurR-regulated permease PerM
MKTRKLVNTFIYFGFFALIFFLLFKARDALVPYAIGIATAYICYPFVYKLDHIYQKKIKSPKKARSLAILSFLVLFFTFLVIFALSVGDMLVEQLLSIGKILAAAFANSLIWLSGQGVDIPETIDIVMVVERLNLDPASILETGLNTVLGTIGAIFSFAISLFMLPFFMFYIMYDPESIKKGLLRLLPKSVRADACEMGGFSSTLLNKYIRTQVMLSVVIFSIMLVGFLLMGMPNAFALAFIAGVLELIPIFGPIIAWLISFIVAVPLGIDMVLWVSVLSLIVQQLEGNYLTPKIQGETVNFPAWVVMLIIVVFGGLFGLVGMVIGLPLVAVFKESIHYIHLRLVDPKVTPNSAAKKVKTEPFEFTKIR